MKLKETGHSRAPVVTLCGVPVHVKGHFLSYHRRNRKAPERERSSELWKPGSLRVKEGVCPRQ